MPTKWLKNISISWTKRKRRPTKRGTSNLKLQTSNFKKTTPPFHELVQIPPHPSPLPAGEREGVRGNFKYVWVEFRLVLVPIEA
jgi:hypothetical protein